MTDILNLILWFALMGAGALGVLVWRRWLASAAHSQQAEARQRQRLEAAMHQASPVRAPGCHPKRIS